MKIIANTFIILAITGIIIALVTMAISPSGSWDMYSMNYEPLYQPLFASGFLIFFGGLIGVCFTYEHL